MGTKAPTSRIDSAGNAAAGSAYAAATGNLREQVGAHRVRHHPSVCPRGRLR
ncbi:MULTISPECIES: hypothetical protein [unclassified Streptomyces]|uniref:hypothetical protein n=1 Tax=unclassified Streptomyces TaxID=2593676 RepID=UPI00332AABEB